MAAGRSDASKPSPSRRGKADDRATPRWDPWSRNGWGYQAKPLVAYGLPRLLPRTRKQTNKQKQVRVEPGACHTGGGRHENKKQKTKMFLRVLPVHRCTAACDYLIPIFKMDTVVRTEHACACSTYACRSRAKGAAACFSLSPEQELLVEQHLPFKAEIYIYCIYIGCPLTSTFRELSQRTARVKAYSNPPPPRPPYIFVHACCPFFTVLQGNDVAKSHSAPFA